MRNILFGFFIFTLLFIGCQKQEDIQRTNSYEKYRIEMVSYSKIHNIAVYEATGEGERYLIFRAGNSGLVVIKK